MTVSERIPFSGLLLPLQEGHTYSCDRCTTDGMELLFVFRENGHSRYYFESDMQGFDRKAASDSHILTVYPQPNGGRRSLALFLYAFDKNQSFQTIRNISADDTLSKTLCNGGLTNARLTNKARIVLCFS